MKTINEFASTTKVKTDKKIVFTTLSSLFIYEAEVSGQISDGYWEDASPRNHSKWLWNIETVYDKDGVQGTNRSMMKKYDLGWIVQHVRKGLKQDKDYLWTLRILKYGRWGRVFPDSKWEKLTKYEFRAIVGDLPEEPCTKDEFEDLIPEHHKDCWNKVKNDITDDLLKKYYETKYDITDLMDDLDDVDASLNHALPNE